MCNTGISYLYLRSAAYAPPLSLHLQIYRGRKYCMYVCCGAILILQHGNWSTALWTQQECNIYIAPHQSYLAPHAHNYCSPTEQHLRGMIIFSYKSTAMTISFSNITIWQSAHLEHQEIDLRMRPNLTDLRLEVQFLSALHRHVQHSVSTEEHHTVLLLLHMHNVNVNKH